MATNKYLKNNEHEVVSRKDQYLVGRRHPSNMAALDLEPLDFSLLEGVLQDHPDIELLDRFELHGGEIEFVVSIKPETAEELQKKFGQAVSIEPNDDLEMFLEGPPSLFEMMGDPSLVEPLDTEEITINIAVKSKEGGSPVAGATVYLIGQLLFEKGITDDNGRVSLTLFGETLETIKGLYVKPFDTYWSLWVENPELKADQDNIASIKKLTENYPGFPGRETIGWGYQAMGLDTVAEGNQGQGIKIAIIDSGLQTEHEDLHAQGGFDFTDSDNPKESWRIDSVRHGSHVAGIIAGWHNARGIQGGAPKAEIHVYKVFPGGKLDSLIKSLDLCIKDEIDIVNLSLGSKRKSERLQQALQEAKENGVACIAAAGNSGKSVQYPAAFSEVLAVAAIGKFGTFPEDSYHHRQTGEHLSGDGQYFAGKFTCFGDEINVCAPGVAVVSSVPDKAFVAWDGTSMACPHVVGFAALTLANMANIRNLPRGSERVDALFAALKAGCNDIGLPKEYQGAGLLSAEKLGIAMSGPGQGEDTLKKLEDLLFEALSIARKQLNQTC